MSDDRPLGPTGCDTMVALGSATADGSVIMGKNSDRPPNEAQPLVKLPRQQHEPGGTVRCTYIEIPQVEETFAVVGSRPHWLWGFEHGMNEHGVMIGNEAVWSKEPPQQEGALLGMDLLRLGLERGRTAYEAMHTIIGLLEEYGQGGNCVRVGDFYYHNSFLIADSDEAWVLETSDRHWVARRITDGTYSISNVYSIEAEWDEASADLVDFAVRQGWVAEGEPFSFSRAYSDLELTAMPGLQSRKNRHTQLLNDLAGSIGFREITCVLRDHYEGTVIEPRFNPANAVQMAICMHACKDGDTETAASAVMQLRPGEPAPLDRVIWASLASPCTSVYTPFYFDAELPEELSWGTHIHEAKSPWWRYEKLQRLAARNYDLLAPPVRALWESLEDEILTHMASVEQQARALADQGEPARAVELVGSFSRSWTDTTLDQAAELLAYVRQLERTTPTPADLNPGFTWERDEAAELDLDAEE